MNKRTVAQAVFTIVILAVLIWVVDPIKAIEKLSQINPLFLLTIFAIFPIFLFINGLNLYVFVVTFRKICLTKILRYYCLAWAAGFFLPGKIGEFSIVYFLKKEGFSTGEATAIALLDKIFRLAILLSIAFAGLFTFVKSEELLFVIFVFTALFLLGLFFIFSKSGREFIKKTFLRKYKEVFTGFSKTHKEYFEKKRSVVINIGLTFLAWTINFLMITLIFFGLGKNINFFTIAFVSAISTIAGMLPITINGVGIKEGTFVLLMRQIGVEASVAFGASIAFTAIGYLAAIIVLLLFSRNLIKAND